MVLGPLLSRLRRTPAFDAPLAPAQPVYAVGDLHGRIDLLEAIIPRIEAHAEAQGLSDAMLLFLGDYIDRGEYSAAVVAFVRSLQTAVPDRVVALMGNHERMMLEFLDDPVQRGRRWLRYGGLQTLASYGVRGITERAGPADLRAAAQHLSDAQPAGEAAWLRGLPSRWQTGNVAFVHAGADPRVPLDKQPDGQLIWGHPDFERVPRRDGLWIAHGHTVVDDPYARDGRIALDTGAYFSGRLTAGAVTQAGVEMIEA